MKPDGSSRTRGTLFWRVYLHGLTLLLLVALTVGVTGAVLRRGPPIHRFGERLASHLSAHSLELLQHPERFTDDLARQRELLGIELSLYRTDGSLLATNVEPPVPPLGRWQLDRLRHRGAPLPVRHGTVAVPVHHEGALVAYAVTAPPGLGPLVSRSATVLALVLGLLALGSIPLARMITRPLETLTASAQRLGAGDLSVRTGIRRQDEVGRLAMAFDEMADRLETLVRGEKELLANVSHELRTPLARIRVALEIAAEGDAERARSYLSEIGRDLGELERLIEDVMVVAKLDLAAGRAGGAPPLHRTRVEVEPLIEASAARFREAHPERTLEVVIADALPMIDADASMMRRVLDNLLDNARKYSDAGTAVVLSAVSRPGEVELAVSDRGIGIDAADLPRLFTPFFRTDRSRARGTGGVGLGLTLARRIVEGHGGRISVQSRPGEGTTFRIALPAV